MTPTNRHREVTSDQKQQSDYLSLLPVIGLLLIYIAMRSYALLSFPPFIDESQQIQFAQQTLAGHILLGARDSRLIVPWWLALFQPYGQAQLWVARIATILFSLVGLAGVYKLGCQLSSRLAGMLAAMVLILSPFSFFFERLVVMDPYVATFGILAHV